MGNRCDLHIIKIFYYSVYTYLSYLFIVYKQQKILNY